MLTPESGIEYPKLLIDGRPVTVKFSRAAIYRLDKAGFDLRSLSKEVNGWLPQKNGDEVIPGRIRYSVMIDLLHAAVGDQLRVSAEGLAEMVGPERSGEVAGAIMASLLKMKPPAPAQETAAPIGAEVQ